MKEGTSETVTSSRRAVMETPGPLPKTSGQVLDSHCTTALQGILLIIAITSSKIWMFTGMALSRGGRGSEQTLSVCVLMLRERLRSCSPAPVCTDSHARRRTLHTDT
ncbi:hypothetical protein FQA47_024257 [Oryzias melastigma]|uniref:Uncharacterized protein n=1 Tax=Oryzias melastigma TaxID=30732 RepID=A0A834F4M6_ORYME|nr:hypothetical protein FQA47_024257 [Oryzias melastigma]